MNDLVIEKDMGLDDPVFISGLTRSGKILLCTLVAALENCDKVNVDFFWEQVPFLNYINKIPDDGAVYLLQAGLNIKVYDNAIGRNANFRPTDYTSVWQYQNPEEYVRRLFLPDGDSVFQSIENGNRIFSMMVHNGLWHSKLLFKAFPRMKMFHMQRNPVDIVFSWIKKGYGGDFYKNKRSSCLTYRYGSEILPYYAYGWEDEYLSCESVDRIIFMVNKIRQCHADAYSSLSADEKARVMFVKHRELAESPEKVIPGITKFLNTKKSSFTDQILLKADCPRVFKANDTEMKLNEIIKLCSNSAYEKLLEMKKEFETNEITI